MAAVMTMSMAAPMVASAHGAFDNPTGRLVEDSVPGPHDGPDRRRIEASASGIFDDPTGRLIEGSEPGPGGPNRRRIED